MLQDVLNKIPRVCSCFHIIRGLWLSEKYEGFDCALAVCARVCVCGGWGAGIVLLCVAGTAFPVLLCAGNVEVGMQSSVWSNALYCTCDVGYSVLLVAVRHAAILPWLEGFSRLVVHNVCVESTCGVCSEWVCAYPCLFGDPRLEPPFSLKT